MLARLTHFEIDLSSLLTDHLSHNLYDRLYEVLLHKANDLKIGNYLRQIFFRLILKITQKKFEAIRSIQYRIDIRKYEFFVNCLLIFLHKIGTNKVIGRNGLLKSAASKDMLNLLERI